MATTARQNGKHPGGTQLAPKQLKFCSEYIQDLNATQAAIRAGYSAKTARSQASMLLTKLNVQEGVRAAQKELSAKLNITPERVLREWAAVAFANMADYTRVNDDGDPIIDLSNCTHEQMAAVSETQTETVVEGNGKNVDVVRKVKIKHHSKAQALEALSKHLGLFAEDNNQRGVVEHKIVLFGQSNPDDSATPASI